MNIQLVNEPRRGHAHDVDLEDTFDFLNTLETGDGFPVEKFLGDHEACANFVEKRRSTSRRVKSLIAKSG